MGMGLADPHPLSLPTRGREAFNSSIYSVNSASSTTFKRKNAMLESPSPLWGGIKGGGEQPAQFNNHLGETP
jgi:hypothetical protein